MRDSEEIRVDVAVSKEQVPTHLRISLLLLLFLLIRWGCGKQAIQFRDWVVKSRPSERVFFQLKNN